MIENPETGALENFNFDQLLQHVPELKRFNYRISSYQFDPPIDSSDMEPSLWAKIVKIINYNYDNRYYFTATFRADGSSKFAKNNRWGYFPAASAGWIFFPSSHPSSRRAKASPISIMSG